MLYKTGSYVRAHKESKLSELVFSIRLQYRSLSDHRFLNIDGFLSIDLTYEINCVMDYDKTQQSRFIIIHYAIPYNIIKAPVMCTRNN